MPGATVPDGREDFVTVSVAPADTMVAAALDCAVSGGGAGTALVVNCTEATLVIWVPGGAASVIETAQADTTANRIGGELRLIHLSGKSGLRREVFADSLKTVRGSERPRFPGLRPLPRFNSARTR